MPFLVLDTLVNELNTSLIILPSFIYVLSGQERGTDSDELSNCTWYEQKACCRRTEVNILYYSIIHIRFNAYFMLPFIII